MFSSVSASRSKAAAKALIIPQFAGTPLDKASAELAGPEALAASRRPESTGDLGRIAEAHPAEGPMRVIIVGLGDADSLAPASLRIAFAAVGRRLAETRDTTAAIDIAPALAKAGIDPAQAGNAIGEAFGLLAWSRDQWKGSASATHSRAKLTLRTTDASLAKGLQRGLGLAESANVARSLSETPPNICSPTSSPPRPRPSPKSTRPSPCKVVRGSQLEKEKLEGLINVGKASDFPPCLIRLAYTPAKPKRAPSPSCWSARPSPTTRAG